MHYEIDTSERPHPPPGKIFNYFGETKESRKNTKAYKKYIKEYREELYKHKRCTKKCLVRPKAGACGFDGFGFKECSFKG